MAEKVVEAGCDGGDATGLGVLGPTDAVPPVDVQIFPLKCHLMPSYHLVRLQLHNDWLLRCGLFLLF